MARGTLCVWREECPPKNRRTPMQRCLAAWIGCTISWGGHGKFAWPESRLHPWHRDRAAQTSELIHDQHANTRTTPTEFSLTDPPPTPRRCPHSTRRPPTTHSCTPSKRVTNKNGPQTSDQHVVGTNKRTHLTYPTTALDYVETVSTNATM